MDLDGDGRLDILSGSIGGEIHWFRRKPNGTYAAGETLKKGWLRPLSVGRGSAVAAADWDGDGVLDLIVGNGEGAVFLIRNEGTKQKPSWGDPLRLRAQDGPISADGGSAAPFVADWDGDGRLDLILGSGSGKVAWYRNVGTATKPKLASAVTLIEAVPQERRNAPTNLDNPQRSAFNSRVCVADWNGDGRPDLLVGDFSSERQGSECKYHGWVWVYLRQPSAPNTVRAAK